MLKPQPDEGFGSISICFGGWAFNSQLRWNQVDGSVGMKRHKPHSHIPLSHQVKCNRTTN